MHRRSIVEVVTGAVVLLVAAGFLAYAIANSGRGADPATRSSPISTISLASASAPTCGWPA